MPREGPRRCQAALGRLFGVEPYIDEPYYAPFSVGGEDVGLDVLGHSKGMTGPIAYWHVDDIDKSLEALLDAGAAAGQPVQDVGDGTLIATSMTVTNVLAGYN